MIRLASDGDGVERACWSAFVEQQFPAYEHYWLQDVVPLRRIGTIHLCSDAELKETGKGPEDVCRAQLHYTVLRHLARVWELRSVMNLSENQLSETLARICSAVDVAFELLQRATTPGVYDPWLEQGKKPARGGLEARKAWKESNNWPLQQIYKYRNRLLHGRLLPSGVGPDSIFVPRIGCEERYMDWRNLNGLTAKDAADFAVARDVVAEAWSQVLKYFEQQWRAVLLKGKTLPMLKPVVASGTINVLVDSTHLTSASFAVSNQWNTWNTWKK